jgi:hypothetical protein
MPLASTRLKSLTITFGPAKDFVAAAVTALEDFENRVVLLCGVIARGQGIVPVRIEGLGRDCLRFRCHGAAALVKLLQGHLHAPTELLGRGGFVAGDRALKVVDTRAEVR